MSSHYAAPSRDKTRSTAHGGDQTLKTKSTAHGGDKTLKTRNTANRGDQSQVFRKLFSVTETPFIEFTQVKPCMKFWDS